MKQKITQAQANKDTLKAIDRTILLTLLAARDEFGLGEKRMANLMERIDRYSDHIDNHRVGMDEVERMLSETIRFGGK